MTKCCTHRPQHPTKLGVVGLDTSHPDLQRRQAFLDPRCILLSHRRSPLAGWKSVRVRGKANACFVPLFHEGATVTSMSFEKRRKTMAFKDRLKDAASKTAKKARQHREDLEAGRVRQAALDAETRTRLASDAPTTPEVTVAPESVLEVKSHDEGRNAIVRVYADRIERELLRSRASLQRSRQDTEVIPMRSVSSVQAKKDGLVYTKVTVFATGNTIEFRLRHEDAQAMKNRVTALLLDKGPAAAVAQPVAPSLGDQVRELGKLRDEGLLSEEEFAAQKAKLLG